jgi:hypothetical protein
MPIGSEVIYGLDAQQKSIVISFDTAAIDTCNKDLLPVVGQRNRLGLTDFGFRVKGLRVIYLCLGNN